MKKIKNTLKLTLVLIVLLSVICSLSLSVFAHSGRTDSNGGHYNRKTGEYHYHGKETDVSSFFAVLSIVVLSALAVLLIGLSIWGTIDDKKQKKIEKQRKIEEQRLFEEERKKYYEMYANKDVLSLCRCPKGTYIGDDGLPTTNDEGKYGKYTVYLFSNSPNNKYHLRENCCSRYLFPSNIVKHLNKEPCWICAKNHSIDTSWYSEYLKIMTIKKTYNIP